MARPLGPARSGPGVGLQPDRSVGRLSRFPVRNRQPWVTSMLSRIAESLYWMARNLERADDSAVFPAPPTP